MNWILKDFQIPSTIIFFDSKVERNIGFIYGLNTVPASTTIVKVPAGLYKDNSFTSFFNFKKNGEKVTPFENNFPDVNSYKESCPVYYIKNDDVTNVELKFSTILGGDNPSGWTTNNNQVMYFFTEEAANNMKQVLASTIFSITNISVLSTSYLIKDLMNDNVFNGEGTHVNFIIDICTDYNTYIQYNESNINYIELSATTYTSGVCFYDAVIQNKIGYIYGLQVFNNIANIIKVPAVRYYENKTTNDLLMFNGLSGTTVFNTLYPEQKSYTNKCKIFFIKNNNNLYFNISSKTWNSDKSTATYFFTEANANYWITKLSLSASVNNVDIAIKYLTNDACVYFPVLEYGGFTLPNINDYIK